MTETRKVLVAAAAGTVVGLVAGILIAPDKGSETRKKIAALPKKTTDYVKEVANKGKESITHLKEKVFGKKELEEAELNFS